MKRAFFAAITILGVIAPAHARATPVFADSDRLSGVCVGDYFVFGRATSIQCIPDSGDYSGLGTGSLREFFGDAVEEFGDIFSPLLFHAGFTSTACPQGEKTINPTGGERFRVAKIEGSTGSATYNCIGDTKVQVLLLTLKSSSNPAKELILILEGPSQVFNGEIRRRTVKELRKKANWAFWLEHGPTPGASASTSPKVITGDSQDKPPAPPPARPSGMGAPPSVPAN